MHRMIHPEHGATHAFDLGEKARLEKLGWEEEKAKLPKPQEKEEEKRGPGRPRKAD